MAADSPSHVFEEKKSDIWCSTSDIDAHEGVNEKDVAEASDEHSQQKVEDVEAQRIAVDLPPYSVFTTNQRRYLVFMVAFAGFFSPLSANIYFPVLNTLATDYSVTPGQINLTITTYMIFQGLAPTFFGDFADMAGRRPAYLIGFTIYIGACIGIACSQSYVSLLVLRCIQSSGSSGTIALASGVIADVSTSSERGVWMGWALSGPMVAPALAPVLGGLLADFLGWRSIFWCLVIAASSYLVLFAVTFPETGRNIVGDGSVLPQGWNMSLLNYLQARRAAVAIERNEKVGNSFDIITERRKLGIPNPLHSLHVFMEKDIALLLFYNAIICCASYDVMASLPYLFEKVYGFGTLHIGLSFLPFGIGCFIAPYISGKIMDWNFCRTAKNMGFEIRKGRAQDLQEFPLERCRLAVVLPTVLAGSAAIVAYGWALDVSAPLAAPLVLLFINGMCITASFNVMSAMLVDLHPQAPATAQAANNLARCLLGAGATAVIIYMLDSMGTGWCFTFIAGVVVALTPILLLLEKYGPMWRKERSIKMELENAKRKAETAIPVGKRGDLRSKS